MKNLRVRSATTSDLVAIRDLLIDADLPVEDLDELKLPLFHLAEREGGDAGVIGMERHGNVGLLRSLVVLPDARGQGLGKKLVDTLEVNALDIGVTELWLLTINAEEFFGRLKYKIIARELAPDVIRKTQEFSNLCPGTAHLMMKSLA